MDAQTHLAIDAELCGQPAELRPHYCRVHMTTTARMAADDKGLVHGGFIFGMADYAAMLAINDPHVVLGAAQTRFLKPARTGEKMVAEAQVDAVEGKKHRVTVTVSREGGETVFDGVFTCFILDRHVLD